MFELRPSRFTVVNDAPNCGRSERQSGSVYDYCESPLLINEGKYHFIHLHVACNAAWWPAGGAASVAAQSSGDKWRIMPQVKHGMNYRCRLKPSTTDRCFCFLSHHKLKRHSGPYVKEQSYCIVIKGVGMWGIAVIEWIILCGITDVRFMLPEQIWIDMESVPHWVCARWEALRLQLRGFHSFTCSGWNSWIFNQYRQVNISYNFFGLAGTCV